MITNILKIHGFALDGFFYHKTDLESDYLVRWRKQGQKRKMNNNATLTQKVRNIFSFSELLMLEMMFVLQYFRKDY